MSANPLTPDSTPLEVRKAWADRLRNPGDIIQGTAMLASGANERCCLGVLCDLAVEAGVITDYPGSLACPEEPVNSWAGLGHGYLAGVADEYGGETTSLTILNDCDGFTFADIADLLDDGLVLGPDGEVLQ